jgi:hypothetical protein
VNASDWDSCFVGGYFGVAKKNNKNISITTKTQYFWIPSNRLHH